MQHIVIGRSMNPEFGMRHALRIFACLFERPRRLLSVVARAKARQIIRMRIPSMSFRAMLPSEESICDDSMNWRPIRACPSERVCTKQSEASTLRIGSQKACRAHSICISRALIDRIREHDNGSVHRARTVNVASKHARKPGFACNTLLSRVFGGARKLL